ncbi:50S ribosomal protein L24 [Patescibacteria group bacterium]|nr:50S ribosomal protein L24 [Patescibacteria group bacterium]
MKLKIGDTILVTAGKDGGKTGKITKTFPRLNKVLVEGINVYKKHVKAQGQGKPGGIIEFERPLPTGNIAIMCSTCKQQTRIGFRSDKSGVKTRICRKCEATIGKS